MAESRKVMRRSGRGQEEIRGSGGERRRSGGGDNSDGKQPSSESTARMEQGETVMVASQTDEEEETLDDPAYDASKKSGNEEYISLADWNEVDEQRGIVKAIQIGEQREDGELKKLDDEKIFRESDDRSPADDASRKFENGKDIYLEDFSDEELVERALEEEFGIGI